MIRHDSSRPAAIALALVCLSVSRLPADEIEQFIKKISSDDKEVRYEARLGAGQLGAPAVAPLVTLMVDGPLEVSTSALRALEVIVHSAGRPGRNDEANAVSRALAALLTAGASQKVKLELLNLIAFIGDDAVVGTVAGMLGDRDPHVSEAARTALERIPGPREVEALIGAARLASPDRRGDFLFSLGKKGDSSVAPFLISNTSGEPDNVRTAAFQALAHLGALEAVEHFQNELRNEDARNRAPVFNEYLRLADNLAVTGRGETSARIYRQCLAGAPLDHQREHALFQLSRGTGPEAVEALIAALADPAGRVSGLAMLRLSEMKGPEVAAALRRAYAGAGPSARAFLLRAIAANDPDGSTALLEEATRDADPGVRVTALDLRGELAQPELEGVFVELAQHGTASVRTTAAKGYLELAQKRLAASRDEGGDAGRKVSAMFTQALAIAPETSQKAAAIDGIKAIGDTGAVDKLEPYLAHPVLGSSASDVYVTLAVKLADEGEIDRAEPLLLKVLDGQFPRSLKELAADKLREKGRDPQARVLDQGFVLDWWLVGPLDNPDGKGLETKFFPEESAPDDEVHNIGPRRYRWQRPRLLTADGTIDLGPRFRRTQNRICYAYTTVVSPNEQDVLFKIGSDDGVACWLGGERIHFNPASRNLTVDQDVVEARLGSGKNIILVKVSNTDGDWQMAFRITDREGKPLRLATANDL